MIKDDEHWRLDMSGSDLKKLTSLQIDLLTGGCQLEAETDMVNMIADDIKQRPGYQSIDDLQGYEVRGMLMEYQQILWRVDRYITKRQQFVKDEMKLFKDGTETLNNAFKDPSKVRS